MRYEDWDILLFPQDCKVPMKEFKVACRVLHDPEFSHSHGSFGLPTVYCFVPSLAAGTPFQISIHHWAIPTVSQATKASTKYSENIQFEARLFIDGRLVASACLDGNSGWPHVIANSFDFSKNGELKPLKFPSFRQELLQQSHWSPGDDLGRIKIVLSEGFPRDSLSMPIERVRNLVAFSFQHAPLEILEHSQIAWPNPLMWRRAALATSMPVPAYPSEDSEAHAHSPRRRNGGSLGVPGYPLTTTQGMAKTAGSGSDGSTQAIFGGGIPPGYNHPAFEDSAAYFEWLGNMGMAMNNAPVPGQGNPSFVRKGRKTSTDTSMPDYVPMHSGSISFPTNDQFVMANFQVEDDSFMEHLKVPSNTPIQKMCEPGVPFPVMSQNNAIPPELAHSLTNSLLNQPMPFQMQSASTLDPTNKVRSRKENRLQPIDQPTSIPAPKPTPALEHKDMRRVSQQMYIPSGNTMPVSVMQQQQSPKSLAGSDLNQETPSDTSFGANITNLAAHDASSVEGAVGSAASSEKGTKRARHYTPGSANTLEDDDPPRGSPRVRLTPFEDVSTALAT